MKTWIVLLILLSFVPGIFIQAQSKKTARKISPNIAVKDTSTDVPKLRVTFVELGSVKCIPCRAMQPVMASIGKKYAGQIKIVFHDVWKSEEQKYAGLYGIKLIPTQVFLDDNGKEFFRHEGFLPEREIDTLLQNRGLKIREGG